MQFKAHIIDDELNGQEVLKNLLDKYCKNIEVIDVSSSVKEAVNKLNKNKADVLFLDIEMPVMNGFKLFDFINAKDYQIIFATAYDQYAIKAIKVAAIDYLLKPIDVEDLQKAVSRLKSNTSRNEQLELLLNNLKLSNKKIAIPISDGFHHISIDSIYYCSADDNYCNIHFEQEDTPIYSPRTLKYFEQRLTDFNFFRCSKSHLINLNFVSQFIRGKNPVVIMKNKQKIKLSANRKDAFIELFGDLQ